jgi:hypothetical protein
MTQISNIEKQARFRKKEQLKRYADNIFRKWQSQVSTFKQQSITSQNVQHSLDKAIDRPSGWTDEHYERAEQALKQIDADLCYGVDQLKNDVDASWRPQGLMTTSDPAKYMSDYKAELEDTRALAAHFISGYKLSNLSDANKAAAVTELLRFSGRFLASSCDVPPSQATTICLASIGPHYNRPDWFVEELENWLRSIDQRLALVCRETRQHAQQ